MNKKKKGTMPFLYYTFSMYERDNLDFQFQGDP